MSEGISYRNTRWAAIGTALFYPAAVAPQPFHMDLFARGATGELLHREGNDTGWSEWGSLGLPVAHVDGLGVPVAVDWPLAACSGDPTRIDLFARSPDGDLLHMTGNGNSWGAFECLGSPGAIRGAIVIPMGLASPPAVCSLGTGRIEVFAVGPEGDLLHTSFNNESWSGFDSLGMPTMRTAGAEQSAPLSGPVAACSSGGTHMAVFVRGPRGDLLLKWWDGARWSGFTSLGFPEVQYDLYPAVNVAEPLTGPPAACSWGPGRMDVFARGPRGDMLHKWWDGEEWSRFESLGIPTSSDGDRRPIPFTGAITACSWGPNRLDVIARALNGNLYHAWWDGSWDHE